MNNTSANKIISGGVLDTLRRTKQITPVAFSGIGSFPCQVILHINACLDEAYGEIAPHLPIALRAIDSAQATKDLTVAIPGSPPRPAPPGIVQTYRDASVPALRAQAERAKGTRALAEKLKHLPPMETLADGCCQKPAFGKALYLANLQKARESIVSSILCTRDANRVAACENAGFRVKPTRQVVMVRFVNGAGSTGSGAEVVDAMMTKYEAAQRGISVVNHLIMLLPSAGSSVNPQAARENAGKLLVEAAMAVEFPDRVVAHSFDGQTFRFGGAPIYDSISVVGVTTEFMAASNRSELAARLALLGLAFIATPLLAETEQHFADSKPAQGNRRHGLPVFTRRGFVRCFVPRERNLQIAKAAATAHLNRNL